MTINPNLTLSNKENIPVGVYRDGDDQVVIGVEAGTGRRLYLLAFGYYGGSQQRARSIASGLLYRRILDACPLLRRLAGG